MTYWQLVRQLIENLIPDLGIQQHKQSSARNNTYTLYTERAVVHRRTYHNEIHMYDNKLVQHDIIIWGPQRVWTGTRRDWQAAVHLLLSIKYRRHALNCSCLNLPTWKVGRFQHHSNYSGWLPVSTRQNQLKPDTLGSIRPQHALKRCSMIMRAMTMSS